MTPCFNLPPGVQPSDISKPDAVCEECGALLEGAEQQIMGLCEACLQIVRENLPE